MKKLVLSALSILLLAGCGGGASNEKVTKTCTMSISGLDTEVVLEGKGKELTNLKATYTMPESMMGIEISEITDEQKTQVQDMLGDSLAKGIGLKKDDLTFEFTDDALKMAMDIDIKNVSDEMKTQFGFKDSTDFEESVKSLEQQGATCK